MTRNMTKKSIIRVAAGAAVTTALTLVAGPALAASTSSTTASTPAPSAQLDQIKAKAKAEIDKRVDSLNHVIVVLNGAKWLGGDQATLVGAAQNDISGLKNLEATIEADTTVKQARTDAATVFTGFRIYALVLPVDHLVRAADVVTNGAVPKLTALENKWAALNDPKIASQLADMQSHTQAAGQAVSGLPAQLEGFTPANWNANHGLLSPARAAVGTARQDLETARQDAREIVAILRSERRSNGAATTTTTS